MWLLLCLDWRRHWAKDISSGIIKALLGLGYIGASGSKPCIASRGLPPTFDRLKMNFDWDVCEALLQALTKLSLGWDATSGCAVRAGDLCKSTAKVIGHNFLLHIMSYEASNSYIHCNHTSCPHVKLYLIPLPSHLFGITVQQADITQGNAGDLAAVRFGTALGLAIVLGMTAGHGTGVDANVLQTSLGPSSCGHSSHPAPPASWQCSLWCRQSLPLVHLSDMLTA